MYSVRLAADKHGQLVTCTEYHPYGEAWFLEVNSRHVLKFNSQELDRTGTSIVEKTF